jgi:hypothetical protein
MDAPSPIKIITKTPDFKDSNEINAKYNFSNNGYVLYLELIEDYILIIVNKNDENDIKYQIKINYDEITNIIPYFKYLNNINDIFKNILQLFNIGKFSINVENDKIKVNIKIMNIFGLEEKHELLLEKIELSANDKINLMKNKIKEFENKIVEINEEKKNMCITINKLMEEKNEMNIKIDDLIKENSYLKSELKNINEKINQFFKEKDSNKNINENLNENLLNNNEQNYNNPKEDIKNNKNNLQYSEYDYDLMICPKEKTDELMIYNKDNNFIKKNLKSKGIKCNVKIDIFPFKSKYVNLGQSLLLTGGMIEEEILNKCYLMSVIKTKNKLDYKIIINSYGDLIEKRERHNIIFLPDKNLVFICSGYLTDKCEYTDLSKGIWEEIKPLNKIRINGAMAYINHQYIYIFCGFNMEGKKEIYLNDLEYFDIENYERGWTTINYMNDKEYNLSFGTIGVIPVEKNSFLICGGYNGKDYNSKIYKIDCSDHEKPIIDIGDKNKNWFIIFRNSLFCKIGQAHFNFDFSSKLYRFNYSDMNLGFFDGKSMISKEK